jgi:hypothetical protein
MPLRYLFASLSSTSATPKTLVEPHGAVSFMQNDAFGERARSCIAVQSLFQDTTEEHPRRTMNGQWLGPYGGIHGGGTMMMNIDDRRSYFQGIVYATPANTLFPITVAEFRVPKDRDFSFDTHEFAPVDRTTFEITRWDAIKDSYPELTSGTRIAGKGSWNEQSLKFSWNTFYGPDGGQTLTSGDAELRRSSAGEPSLLESVPLDWGKFKEFVGKMDGTRYLFRGQCAPWRLRTAFHRRGRANLLRFISEDIPALHRYLSVRTRHIFDLSKPEENGAFFNLVQHHGYPTPLLDWTYSPYVAAFFAYRNAPDLCPTQTGPDARVRILVLDATWRSDIVQQSNVDRPFPHFSVGDFIAIENERVIPQQSVSTITNVDDVETFVKSVEAEKGKKYLYALDLPLSQRNEVYRELNYMGVTAGSMFPGLDGACEDLKERNF